MSAIVCGKRRSFFEEISSTSAPSSSKRLRCSSTSPIRFSPTNINPFSHSSSSSSTFLLLSDNNINNSVASAALDHLISIFPGMDKEVALDIDYHHNMLLSHQKVNPNEVIVGWYSTGFGVSGGCALIHEFYSREVPNPVHLTVDTGFTNGEASIKAFISVNLTLGDRQLAAQFHEIPLDLRMIEAERVGCTRHALNCLLYLLVASPHTSYNMSYN